MTLRWILTLTLALVAGRAVPAAAQEVTFGPNSLVNREVDPLAGGREVVAAFRLTAKAAISVDSLTIEMSGSGNDNGITVHVLIDANGNGLADDDERSAGARNAGKDDDTVVLDTIGNLAIDADQTVDLLVAYDFNGQSRSPGDTFSCSVTDATNDLRAANTGLPVGSAVLTVAGGGSLTFEANTAADRTVDDGESAAVPAAWRVHASKGDRLDLLTLVVEASGTGDHTTDLRRVMLVQDDDQDGRFDPGGVVGPGDPILSEGTFADDGRGTICITFDDRGNPLINIDEDGVNLIVVFEFTGSLTNGQTFGAVAVRAITNVNGADVAGLPADTAVLTVSNPPVTTLTVTDDNPADYEVESGATDVLVGVFVVASNGGLGQITEITFDGIGDARDDLDILAVRLIRDANGNGAVDAGDEQLGESTFSEDGGTISFDLSAEPLNVPDTTAVTLLVVVDLNSSVPDGVMFGVTLSDLTTALLTAINGLPVNSASITIVVPDTSGGGDGENGGSVGVGGGCALAGTNGNAPAAGWLALMALLMWLVAVRLRGRAA